jgi:D-amino-acid dehydrogenase
LTKRSVRRILVEGNAVRGVVVDGPEERVAADTVVLAAGSWSRELARTLGIKIPMQPAKGSSCTIDTYDGAPLVPILNKERRVIVTPLDSRLRFGGTLELTGFDATIHGPRYDAVIRGGHEVLKTPPPMNNEEPWSGLRPVTPDGLPIIDRSPAIEGLIIATGHAMLGFTQSPMTGKLVAELANGEATSISLESFRLDRF